MKSQVLFCLAIEKKIVIMHGVWQRSSVVEQRNHNPLVGGPNPSAATKIQTVRKGGFNFGIVVADEDPKVRQNSRFCKCNAAKPLRFGKGPAHKVCGNTQSLRCYQNKQTARWVVFLFCASGW